jgi:hypothetical protein
MKVRPTRGFFPSRRRLLPVSAPPTTFYVAASFTGARTPDVTALLAALAELGLFHETALGTFAV